MCAAIAFKKEKSYGILTFEGEAKKQSIKEIRQTIESTSTDKECKALLVDFSATKNIDESTMIELVLGAKKLRQEGIKLYVVKASNVIQSRIFNGGLSQLLNVRENEEEALIEIGVKGGAKLKVDVGVINPFLEGAVKTLKVQANLESTPGAPFLKGNGNCLAVDVVAILGIVSERFNGSIALCFPKALFLHIVNGMLGENYVELDDENADAAGELLNIIFGTAKETLNKTGFGIQPAIPTVIHGNSLQMKNIMPDPTVVLPMTTPQGNYEVHIGIVSKS